MRHTTRTIVTIALGLALGACDGGGDEDRTTGPASDGGIAEIIAPAFDPNLRVDDPAPLGEPEPVIEPGRLQGRVVDASSGDGLGGATLVVRRADRPRSARPLARGTSRPDGGYTIDDLPLEGASLAVEIVLDGYLPERVESVRPSPIGDRVSLERVRLVPAAGAATGSIAGRLVDIDGEPLAGVPIEFVTGIGRTGGEGALVTTTDADGRWSFAELAYGNWTCIVYGPDGAVTRATVTVASPEPDALEPVALPALAAGERLVVVTRGDWFQSVWSRLAAPDDDVDPAAFGGTLPLERITEPGGTQVTRVQPGTGTLRFVLRKHPLAIGWSDFDFTVRVIGPEGVLATYTDGSPLGNFWRVFDMDLETGEILAAGGDA